ncbi:MAG TPA: hypothetical protein VG275_05440 [Solirubrobacteraceae bacterium]|nr:hypothetical protein [Solirubrobacteraceae bacterium]
MIVIRWLPVDIDHASPAGVRDRTDWWRDLGGRGAEDGVAAGGRLATSVSASKSSAEFRDNLDDGF